MPSSAGVSKSNPRNLVDCHALCGWGPAGIVRSGVISKSLKSALELVQLLLSFILPSCHYHCVVSFVSFVNFNHKAGLVGNKYLYYSHCSTGP